MTEFFSESVYFGVTVSLLAYGLGTLLRKKLRSPLCNPLLVSIVLTMALLAVSRVSYERYCAGAQYLSYLLTPATVALAIPLYRQLPLLRRHWRAILAGVTAGVLTSLGCILGLSLLFGLEHGTYVTLLPKSITTAIGIAVSQELGGQVSVTAAVIILTGVLGSVIAEPVCRLFRVTEPIARGIAIGSASHAIGTSRAMELGPVEGAMSGLSIVVAGVLTVLAAPVFARLL